MVQWISLTRTLRGRRKSHVQKRSALATKQNKSWTLLICPGKYDLYQISQALVNLLLVRPKLHSTLTLEMLLSTDLLDLKARGYNVERILKQKAHEARVAEETRQKHVEEEQRQLQDREAEWAKTRAEENGKEQNTAMIPGHFPGDSPPNGDRHVQQLPQPNQDRRPGNLFSNLTRRLLDAGEGKSSPSRSPSRCSPLYDPPPPYSASDSGTSRPEQQSSVKSPHQLQSELLSAVQACRPNGSSDVYSPPQVNQVTESKSYCDERPSHDLEFVASLPSGINILLVRSIRDRSAFLAQNSTGINLFTSILLECATVFSMRSNSLSIFYDPGGKTIAFNRNGSIFCNYYYFKELHQRDMVGSSDKSQALVYWYVILCHELAHNLFDDHGPAHSYYRYDNRLRTSLFFFFFFFFD